MVDWNIDRGLRLKEIIEFLDAQRADVLMLQEVDLNARRTQYRNIAEEIAKQLRMNCVFGCEFEELAQGRRDSPAFHGQATLSRWPLLIPRVIRFHHQTSFWKPKWFLPRTEPFQQRLGGRIAVITEVKLCALRVVTYNVHIESRGDKQLKLSQFSETLDDAKQYPRSQAVVLAGDLNLDLNRSSVVALGPAGFHSAIALPSPHTTTARGLFRQGRTIDCAYLAGPIQSKSGRVFSEVNASDHYPLLFEVRFAGSRDAR
ncbi:MAG TPA: endonuclease/exonuclease/phosphatase family protein [Bryobacteraceae bacterium]|nr:endonuclease/exonuclease/phosphatase family protein [Bryobacteraceae bacterium]